MLAIRGGQATITVPCLSSWSLADDTRRTISEVSKTDMKRTSGVKSQPKLFICAGIPSTAVPVMPKMST